MAAPAFYLPPPEAPQAVHSSALSFSPSTTLHGPPDFMSNGSLDCEPQPPAIVAVWIADSTTGEPMSCQKPAYHSSCKDWKPPAVRQYRRSSSPDAEEEEPRGNVDQGIPPSASHVYDI